MAFGRKKALKRLKGHAQRVEEHLRKIAARPHDRELNHWKWEACSWIHQIEEVLDQIGKKTAAVWTARLDLWRNQLEH